MTRLVLASDGIDAPDRRALLCRMVRQVHQGQVEGRLPHLPLDGGGREAERWLRLDGFAEPAGGPLAGPMETPIGDPLGVDKTVQPVASGEPGAQPLLMPMRSLLLDHRAVDDPVWTVVAHLLASACFGGRHLWQDLGATGREEVTWLMATGFRALHDSNHRHLRWKRHLFLCLGERLGEVGLRPPKCDGCDQYRACFDTPDGGGRILIGRSSSR